MAGFMDILGTMVQQGMAQSGGSRVSNAFGAGEGGSLNDIIGSLGKMMGGMQSGGTSSAGAGGLGNLGGVIGEVLGGLGNNKTALGGLGALAGAVLGGGGRSARGAIGGGGLAMLASLAFSALKKIGQAPQRPPRALFEPETSADAEALERDAEIIVKAMINAAKADGQIDQSEVERIVGKLEEGGLTEEEKAFFMEEANKPLDLDAVVASAAGEPDMAAQIYAASLLAIEVDTEAERQYMAELASRLNLHPGVVAHIEQALGVQA
jgi:uncharacterized membrane protein YebE (DUF533 family)